MKHLHAGAEENRGLVVRDELAQTYGDVCRCDSRAASPESPAAFRSDGSCEDGAHSTRPRITTWEAGWNVTNAIQVSTHTPLHHTRAVSTFSFQCKANVQLAAGTVHTTQHTGIH